MRRTRWAGAVAALLLAAAGATATTQVANAVTPPVTTGLGQTFGGPAHAFSVSAGYPGGTLVKAWSKTFGGVQRTPLIVGSAVVSVSAYSGLGGQETDLQAFDGSTGKALWPPIATPGVTSVTSDGTRIFATSQESVLAVDLASGRMLWNHRISPGVSFTGSVPAMYGGLVWVNDQDNVLGLAALDPATGTVVHRYPADSTTGGLALIGHKLYDNVCGYDLTTGAFTPLPAGTQGADCNVQDSLTQSDGTVVVDPAYNDFSHLSVNDLASGRRLFLAPVGLAALDGGRLLVATARKTYTLTSFDETTGAQRWSIGLPARPTAQPLVFGGAALISTSDGHLRRYSTATGSLLGDTTLTGRPIYRGFDSVIGAMVTDSGLLAVPADHTLNVFRGSTTGTPAVLNPAATPKPAVLRHTGADRADGSQYAQDAAHDGVASGSTLTGPLHLAWSKSLPGAVSNAVVDSTGRVFVASADPASGFDVYRLNRKTGAPIWGPVRFPAGINQTRTRLAAAGGVLVEYETPPLLTGNGGAVLHGLDPATGRVLWTTALAPQVYGYDSAPAINAGRVLVHYYDDRYGGVVLAFDLHTGKPDWGSTVLQAMDMLSPTAGGSLIYASGVASQLYAVDAATGRPVFHADSTEDGGGTSSAVYAAGRVYVNDFAGDGSVFDATTGLPLDPGMFATRRPAVDAAANEMIALQGNRVTAERLTDRSRYWTVTVSAVPSVSPVIANGMVITGDDSGRLLVLDEATGKQLWSDPNAIAPSSQNLMQEFEPAQLTVGAGGLAVTSGSQLRFYAGAVDNGPATP